jgi:tetratricopeptide (TPR) repeat protein
LLDGTKIPKPQLLPDDVKGLAARNSLDVRHATFHSDLDRLVRELKQISRNRYEISIEAPKPFAGLPGVTALAAKQDDPQEAAEARRKAAEEPEATPKTEIKERRERPSAAATSVPWRIIFGSVGVIGILCVIAVVAVLPLRSPVTPQPAPAITSPSAPADKKVFAQDASAMFNLGKSYERGDGVTQDYGKAREWYEKAAAKGDGTAMYNLGVLYDNGHGVARDYGKAREWFEKAAAKDNPDAMFNVGVLYEYGLGVAQDYGKAREWFEKAAAKGNATAMWNLGLKATQPSPSATSQPAPPVAPQDASAMNSEGDRYRDGQGGPRATPRRANGTRRPPPKTTQMPCTASARFTTTARG